MKVTFKQYLHFHGKRFDDHGIGKIPKEDCHRRKISLVEKGRKKILKKYYNKSRQLYAACKEEGVDSFDQNFMARVEEKMMDTKQKRRALREEGVLV